MRLVDVIYCGDKTGTEYNKWINTHTVVSKLRQFVRINPILFANDDISIDRAIMIYIE